MKYAYDADRSPPAPVVLVTIRRPDCREQALRVRTLLDSGADVSVVPAAMVKALGGLPAGECTVCGVGDTTIGTMLTYFLEFELGDCCDLVGVVACGEEVIAGRNWLNSFRVVLDGPRQTVTVEPRATP